MAKDEQPRLTGQRLALKFSLLHTPFLDGGSPPFKQLPPGRSNLIQALPIGSGRKALLALNICEDLKFDGSGQITLSTHVEPY